MKARRNINNILPSLLVNKAGRKHIFILISMIQEKKTKQRRSNWHFVCFYLEEILLFQQFCCQTLGNICKNCYRLFFSPRIKNAYLILLVIFLQCCELIDNLKTKLFTLLPYCFNNCSFIIYFESKKCDTYSFVHLSRDCFIFMESFLIPYEFSNFFPVFKKMPLIF